MPIESHTAHRGLPGGAPMTPEATLIGMATIPGTVRSGARARRFVREALGPARRPTLGEVSGDGPPPFG